MKRYRITKYNPLYRDEDGCYSKNEWTAVTDIGQIYDGVLFDRTEYLKIEHAYIDAVNIIMNENCIKKMVVADLEKKINWDVVEDNMLLSESDRTFCNEISEGLLVDGKKINDVVKLVLREAIWCVLYSMEKHFFIKFGYDYYMYIVCDDLSEFSKKKIENLGIYVEDFEVSR